MSTKEKNSKIIFVNSFKGGAGKTTLALSYCVNQLFGTQEGSYENIVYIDLDIQGTGTCYLFGDMLDEKHCFEKTGNAEKISLQLDDKQGELYVAYLNPLVKIRHMYGDNVFANHRAIDMEQLRIKVMKFIHTHTNKGVGTLYVVDCAPGFSELEQALLADCYEMKSKKNFEVEEHYVTTLDSAHIQKCMHCLKDSIDGMQLRAQYRNIYVVINDMQNYLGALREVDEVEGVRKYWESIIPRISKELGETKASLIAWSFSKEIAQQSVFGAEGTIVNHPDYYIFTDENYRVIYP